MNENQWLTWSYACAMDTSSSPRLKPLQVFCPLPEIPSPIPFPPILPASSCFVSEKLFLDSFTHYPRPHLIQVTHH